MMLGETHRHPDPTVHVPSWPYFDDDLTANNHLQEALAELPCYLPSDEPDFDSDSEIDAYSCDHFRMFELKVRLCRRPRPHDWTECPYAHPGEKARRRDPRKFHYSGTGCSDFRKGNCRKGESCQFAHGVFESWLHPARYRTLPCKDGSGCRRRVCFFAHTPDQLRVVSPPAEPSPPVSPMAQSPSGSIFMTSSINSMVASLRNLQLVKVKSLPSSRFGSPRGVVIRPGFCSLPSTPTQNVIRPGYLGLLDDECEEEPVMERVESGRHLRSKMFEKLGKENSLERDKSGQCHGGPNVDWVSDLVN